MILAIVLAFCLVAATFTFHYRVLLWLGSNTPRLNLPTQTQVLVIVVVLFLTHMIHVDLAHISWTLTWSGFIVGLL